MTMYVGKCWHCSLTCEEKAWPLLMPKDTEYKIKAVTCSFPCLIAYINRLYKYNKQKKEKLLQYAKQLFVMRFDRQPRSLEASPPCCMLTIYGGRTSVKRYRD
jgi:hypothetical protein